MMMPMISRIPDEFKRVLEKSVHEIKAMAERLKVQADSMSVEPLNQDPELLFLPTFLDDFVLQKQFEFTPRKGLILKYFCHDTAAQSYIKVNSLELKSILSNLVNNAAESYGQKSGEIRVGLSADEKSCIISVSDDGAGIPKEYLDKLGSERITFKGGASRGVGLVHAFKTIEAWGGHVVMESVVGLGTTVTIRIEKFIAIESVGISGQSREAAL
jgi:signal transduction histidine kinase